MRKIRLNNYGLSRFLCAVLLMCASALSAFGCDSIAVRIDTVYGYNHFVSFKIPETFQSGSEVFPELDGVCIAEFRWEESSDMLAEIQFIIDFYEAMDVKVADDNVIKKSYSTDNIGFTHRISENSNFIALMLKQCKITILAHFKKNQALENMIYSFLKSIKIEPLSPGDQKKPYLFNQRKHNRIKPRVKIE